MQAEIINEKTACPTRARRDEKNIRAMNAARKRRHSDLSIFLVEREKPHKCLTQQTCIDEIDGMGHFAQKYVSLTIACFNKTMTVKHIDLVKEFLTSNRKKKELSSLWRVVTGYSTHRFLVSGHIITVK